MFQMQHKTALKKDKLNTNKKGITSVTLREIALVPFLLKMRML